MSRGKPKGTLELVEWRDAAAWTDAPDPLPKDYVVLTVGWVRQHGSFLRVDQEFTPEQARGTTIIPTGMVLRRTPLVPSTEG